MTPKIEGSQRDFSAGEVDVSLKRADDNAVMKAGARQLSNWRIRNSKAVTNRPGRTALFLAVGRVDEVAMSPGNNFFINFGNGTVKVFNAAGAQVFTQGSMPWVPSTAAQVVWDVYQLSIYITFPGSVPRVLTWDGVSTWSVANYAEELFGTQKRTAFYRISPRGVTMQPSATTGSVTLTFSAGMNLVAGHVGTRMRYGDRQLLITAVASPVSATATVLESLYFGVALQSSGADMTQWFQVGDVITRVSDSAQAIVTGFTSSNTVMHCQCLSATVMTSAPYNAVGPRVGAVGITSAASEAPEASTVWDDELMNSFRGYPQSVFVDQNRLGLCDFPGYPGAVVWSAIGDFNDLYTDQNNAGPDNAINEIAPNKSRVMFVVPGMQSAEFVFCDNAVYYVPIDQANPLKPGSVAFNLVSREGSAKVQPRSVGEVILWINAGLTSVLAIVAPGSYSRPFEARNLSALHSHLIKSPVAVAVPTSTSQFEERYAYILNGDGSIAAGKYEIEGGQIKGVVGWLPWSGAGTVSWISAFVSDLLFSTSYAPNGITAVNVIEKLDATQYLDGAMSVNNAPAAFAPGGGQGPLWWLAGGTVDLMDNTTRMMGTYTIDASGNIIPQNNGGENLLSAALMAGQTWTAILEPFVPDASPGQSVGQRMFKRRVSRMAVYVIKSSGFLFARLFSGPLTPSSPALGTVMNSRRIATWNQGDNPTQAPPLRETVERWRPLGRSYDPRVAIIKDTPGPLEIAEIGIEATI